MALASNLRPFHKPLSVYEIYNGKIEASRNNIFENCVCFNSLCVESAQNREIKTSQTKDVAGNENKVILEIYFLQT